MHNLKFLGDDLEVRIWVNGEFIEAISLEWEEDQVLYPEGWGDGLVLVEVPVTLHEMLGRDLACHITDCIFYWTNEDGGVLDHEMELDVRDCEAYGYLTDSGLKITWAVRPREER